MASITAAAGAEIALKAVEPAWTLKTILIGNLRTEVAAWPMGEYEGAENLAGAASELCVVSFCPLSAVAAAPIVAVEAIAPPDAVAASTAAVQQRAALGAVSAGDATDPVASRLDASAASRAMAGAASLLTSPSGTIIGALGQALFDSDAAALLCRPLLPGQSQADTRITHCLIQAPLAPLVSSPQTLTAIGASHLLTLRTLSHPASWPAVAEAVSAAAAGPRGDSAGAHSGLTAPLPLGVLAGAEAAAAAQGTLHLHDAGVGTSLWLSAGRDGTESAVRAELRVLLGGWATGAAAEGLVLPDATAVARAAQWAVDAARVAGGGECCEEAARVLEGAARRIRTERGEEARDRKPDGKKIKRAAAARAQATAVALQALVDRLRSASALYSRVLS